MKTYDERLEILDTYLRKSHTSHLEELGNYFTSKFIDYQEHPLSNAYSHLVYRYLECLKVYDEIDVTHCTALLAEISLIESEFYKSNED